MLAQSSRSTQRVKLMHYQQGHSGLTSIHKSLLESATLRTFISNWFFPGQADIYTRHLSHTRHHQLSIHSRCGETELLDRRGQDER